MSERTRLDDERPLYFLHVPKTAGTTLIHLLDQRFRAAEICPYHDEWEIVREFGREELAQWRFVRGHFGGSLCERIEPRPQTLTFLRDPVARAISEFEQIQRYEPHPLHRAVVNLSLQEFVDDRDLSRDVVDDPATRLIADDTDELATALERIEAMDFVGVTERFDEALELFSHAFGVPPIERYTTLQVSPTRDARADLDASLLDQIAERNVRDRALYERACEIFDRRVRRMRAEEADPREIVQTANPPQLGRNDLSRVDFGAGWHAGETHERLGPFRWTGPGRDARLAIALPRSGPAVLRMRVIHALDPAIVEGLQIAIGDDEFSCEVQPARVQGWIAYAELPAEVVARHFPTANIAIRVPRTLAPRTLDPTNSDWRELGVAIQWVEVDGADRAPAERSHRDRTTATPIANAP